MIYKQRLNGFGYTGAILLMFGTPLSLMIQINAVAEAVSNLTTRFGGPPDGIPSLFLFLLWSVPFCGFTLLLIGREYHLQNHTPLPDNNPRSGGFASIPDKPEWN